MRHLNRVLIAATALTLAATTAASATEAGASPSATATATVSGQHDYVSGTSVASGGKIHGIALTQADHQFATDLNDIPRLAADGVNTVDLYITEYQANAYANDIYDGKNTPTAGEVETAIQLAHDNGMAVEMMPIVWTTNPFMWRGDYVPGDVDHWFASYTTMIDRWAEIAQAYGAEMFAVGTEYQSLEQYTAQWEAVIKSVRAIYSGELTYMSTAANFWHVKFWNAVDDIGVSPYWSLSRQAVPSVPTLMRAWKHKFLPRLKKFSARWHRPILFDELGYESIQGAAFEPFKHPNGTPSEQAQANAYQAAINVVDAKPWLRGVIFFTWGPPVVPNIDTSYNPAGKLAECVMAKSWSSDSSGLPACAISAGGGL